MLKLSWAGQNSSLTLPYLPQSYNTAAEEAAVKIQLRHQGHYPTDSPRTYIITEINIEIDLWPPIGIIWGCSHIWGMVRREWALSDGLGRGMIMVMMEFVLDIPSNAPSLKKGITEVKRSWLTVDSWCDTKENGTLITPGKPLWLDRIRIKIIIKQCFYKRNVWTLQI